MARATQSTLQDELICDAGTTRITKTDYDGWSPGGGGPGRGWSAQHAEQRGKHSASRTSARSFCVQIISHTRNQNDMIINKSVYRYPIL